MSSNGELMTLGRDDEELLNAARVSMGMFGVIISLTIQCEERYNISRHDHWEDLDKVNTDLLSH